MSAPLIHVAVGVIKDKQGNILVSQRAEHVHQGGRWEFPGGKVEATENVTQALQRELDEELGIEIQRYRPLIRIPHTYTDKRVLLDVWQVDEFNGEPHGVENQPLQWVEPGKLAELKFPAANLAIISAVNLPSCYLVSGHFSQRDEFLQRLRSALERGLRLVQYRVRHDYPQWHALAREALACCREYGAKLLLNATPDVAIQIGADGVHLNTNRLMQSTETVELDGFIVAASVHNEAELAQANERGVDFSLLSPVLATSSHPHAEPIGWSRFAKLTELATHPVYALGGMRHEHLELAWSHGGQGIAAIKSLWDSE